MNNVQRLLALATLAGMSIVAAGVASGATAPAMSRTEAAVIAAESLRFRAQVEKDVAALQSLLADDLGYTHSSGVRQNKGEYISDIASGKTVYKSVDASNQQVRIYGNTAVVTGTVKVSVTSAGVDRVAELLYTDVHVQRGGRWQLVAWQSTTKPR
jgi:hypothetical protein